VNNNKWFELSLSETDVRLENGSLNYLNNSERRNKDYSLKIIYLLFTAEITDTLLLYLFQSKTLIRVRN